MIQLNLLPDVKLEYIRSQRARRLTLSVAIIVSGISIALLVLLLSYDGLQKKHLSDLNHDISTESSQLKGKPQINKILTIQNQLESLTALHAGKPAASEVFSYLDQVTPNNVSISNFTIDFGQKTVTITGAADTLSSVNQYVDTLKHTTYTTKDNTTASPAFNSIVLTAFGLTTGGKDGSQDASYTITLSYDQTIFDITQSVTLSVPSIVTTRAEIAQPDDLFKASTSTTTTSGGSH